MTNKRDQIDSALRRPGRLDREVEIGVPTAAERAQVCGSQGMVCVCLPLPCRVSYIKLHNCGCLTNVKKGFFFVDFDNTVNWKKEQYISYTFPNSVVYPIRLLKILA